MIHVESLTKRYDDTLAVDDLSFTVEPGKVTGFLGPNGAGKSTTMRMILGLDEPTGGRALVNGTPYAQLQRPLTQVGALLDAKATHGKRSARDHLRALAAANGIPEPRVDEVLGLVGLSNVAKKKAKGFSLGMGQRLGIAAALLGDPAVLLLDEPVNGLDPEGVLWIRGLMKQLAAEGRTVLVSSHLMNEMAVTADHLVIIAGGRLLADTTMEAFIAEHSADVVLARVAEPDKLHDALTREGHTCVKQPDGSLEVHGATVEKVGHIANAQQVPVFGLSQSAASLEEAFMRITHDHTEYRATVGGRR
ncbi:ATP-binding cassette domain-containing protein [Streptomyces sp. NPDC051994]|uniref:ABC transporter ATP-binding protein n=1 Tax=unclassified Streptomyces TaxID=2593676 RepID=UPI0034445FD2